MIRKFKFLVPIILIIGFSTSFKKVNNTDPKDKVLITILNYVLTQWHYHPQDINDSFSENVYTKFIDNLDPTKRYFLQADIDEFSKYKKDIDDQIKKEDLSFFNLVFERFSQRTEESKAYYKEILNSRFNFNIEDTLNVDYDAKQYAKNKNELILNWKKQLKFSALSKLYDKINDENDKFEKDSSYHKKSIETLEAEARKSTLENMDEYFMRLDELNESDWFSTYINSISEEFDPHTNYYDPDAKKGFDQDISGKLEGIGARLQKKNDYTKVSELVSGGPAWKQGELEAEDLILKVGQGDEEPVNIVGMRLSDAIQYIKGKKGTEVKLTVKKVDGTTKVISIIRDVVELEETFVKSSVVKKDNRTFGLIHLPKFYIDFDEKNYRNSTTDMAQEIERLKKENVEGLIIDLRNNGGGSLQTAVEISGLFIDKGPVVQVKSRDKNADVLKDVDSKIQWDGPLVILVNEFSASASEIFAAAMQDYKRAVIIGGKQTYGKGTVQRVLDLNRYHNLKEDIGALKMTVQKFYRINGGSTQLEGVHSDIVLPDRFMYLEIGERDLTNPLAYDKVPEANYSLWNNYENFDSAINNSKKRVANNNNFKLINDNAKWLKDTQDDTLIYLSLDAYKKDLENNKNESIKYKSISDFTTNLTFNSPQYELSKIEADKDLADKRTAWHKNLKKDIYVDEALNVLSELKIKSKNHLVKN
ncbi:carboxy terminal-processing peptidase [Lutibacter sp. A80]|uniref:carboxy terminal-processing peptidase n=1 Tax=Lutibacter sp. A80 TaxID=2918453 RepID=UPI001F069954|nr:carboxy terminal-processing peptidase [Lutibacter sp. A80]UMB60364.1 carboxy terminal-processing peptidase [Lutibacter sp. A80]